MMNSQILHKKKVREYFSLDIEKPLHSYQKENILNCTFKERVSFYKHLISLYKQLPSLEKEMFKMFMQNDESEIDSFEEMNEFFDEFYNAPNKINSENNKMKI